MINYEILVSVNSSEDGFFYIAREPVSEILYPPLYFIPNISGFDLLFFNIYRSWYSPFIVFSFLFALGFIGNKMQSKLFSAIAIIMSLSVIAAPLLYWHWLPGSIVAFHLSVALVMAITVFLLNFVKFSLLDYTLIFSCFAYTTRFAGITSPLIASASLFGVALPALYVLITILIVYKIRLKELKGKLFYCWFTFALTFIKGYIVSQLFAHFIISVSQSRATRIEALFVWCVAILIVCAIGAAFLYSVKWLLQKHFDNINRMGKAYPQIERFFIYNSAGILIFMALLHSIYGTTQFFWDPIYEIFTVSQNPFFERSDLFLLFAMTLQLSFLIMFFRITWLKDILKTKAIENQSLAAYSSSLEQNIDNIKGIKHDVKNIFLTMGTFVEQSGNAEMKDFYHEKISPFAGYEITKNDLYSKLIALSNEQLKAFMFYKISQAIERNINVDLTIATQEISPEFTYDVQVEFVDLVRILGILLDNAIEECLEHPCSSIHIKISRNNNAIAYTIKNTIRNEIKENGVRPGLSTKGESRGKGLIIVRSILENYSFAALNSYFSGVYFIQNLVIYTS